MSETYSQRLEAVNKRLNLMNIRGKEYAEVNQRILGFWELFPNGRIVTVWPVLTDTEAICHAFVFRDENLVEKALGAWGWNESMKQCQSDAVLALYATATGTAREVKTGSGVNSTSYVENCETSAIGRALGMLGIGATTAIASAEEVSNAINQQKSRTSHAEASQKPVTGSSDKVPAKAKKSPQTGSESLPDPTEAARLRLVDACKMLALATNQNQKAVMQECAKYVADKTEAGYTKAAQIVEKLAEQAGGEYAAEDIKF